VSVDPVAVLMAGTERPASPRPEFEQALRAQLLAELRESKPAGRRWLRVAVIAAVAFVLLAAIATATYLATRPEAEPPVQSAQLTIVAAADGGNGVASILAVEAGGHVRTLWRCPGRHFCGDLTSLAWSPDGTRLAFTLDELGGRSPYVGLHIVTLSTGRDRHIPSLPLASPTRPQPASVLEKLGRQAIRRLGCPTPTDLAWSPGSRRLAYSCAFGFGIWPAPSSIFVIRADGSHRTRIRTGVRAAFWPSWSPDGTRIAFATARVPRKRTRRDTTDPYTIVRSSIYTVRLDGSERRLLATEATAPDWSPDGKAIAYQSSCGGVRLVSPNGVDLTPAATPGGCTTIGVPGRPSFSPDGLKIAIASTTDGGVYLMNPDGTELERVTANAGTGTFDTGRPAWRPASAATGRLRKPSEASPCRTCLP
jgi:Tol biopolymer transport system component